MSLGILVVLLVLSFFILKPILLSIILGFILAFIFSPVYSLLLKWTKSPNFSATSICVVLITLLILPIWFFAPIILEQSFKIYLSAQQMDFVVVLKKVFPSLFSSDQFSAEIGSTIKSFISNIADSVVNAVVNLITNFPSFMLQILVVLFTFFFVLRDGDNLVEYIKSLLPFPKEVEKKLFASSREITKSVLYGQVILGIIQGIVAGIGFFIFGVPNAWVLTLLALIAGVLPIIGPMLISLPVVVYLILADNNFAAIGVFIFGIIASNIDNLLRPLIVSRRSELHPSLVLIGMIGGVFFFGVLGLILGPLILAYLLIVLEVFRDRKSSAEGGGISAQ